MLTLAKKPHWLNKKINLGDCAAVQTLLGGLNLRTVCQEASCPNIGECFSRSRATFLILGDICTRNCSFCGVQKGKPGSPDSLEPSRVAMAIKRLNLRHAVITSVTRDDLLDGGAQAFAETVRAVRRERNGVIVEVLIPDFQLNKEALKKLVEVKPEIIGHNIETVPALYDLTRRGASYGRSLEVLAVIKEFDSRIHTKSGIMLGMGEEEAQVLEVLRDLRKANCDFLSIGQYLSPSVKHFPVKEYISPGRFDRYRDKALEYGFKFVASGPYVRSSYLAEDYLSRSAPRATRNCAGVILSE